MIDQRTENLITRRLDGELREDESLELNKTLLRNRDARHCLEDQERIDRLACETLEIAFSPHHRADGSDSFRDTVVGSGRFWRWSRNLISVAAVVVVVLGVGWLSFRTSIGVPDAPAAPSAPPAPQLANSADISGFNPLAVDEPLFEPAMMSPEDAALLAQWSGKRHVNHNLLRDALGFYDDRTGCLLVLERDRRQTKVVPVVASY